MVTSTNYYPKSYNPEFLFLFSRYYLVHSFYSNLRDYYWVLNSIGPNGSLNSLSTESLLYSVFNGVLEVWLHPFLCGLAVKEVILPSPFD